ADRIRGELACRGGAVSIRSNLVFGTTSREIGDHDAVMRIGGEAPKGRPILHERRKGHGWVRDTATSDRHRQSLTPTQRRAEWGLSHCWFTRHGRARWPAQATSGRLSRRTPSGSVPVVASSQSAIRSLRASATIITFL